MMEIVSSRNLFVDTSDRLDSQTGDDCTIHLSGNGIRAGDGQLLRLSVMSFTMYRNVYQINVNNSRIRCEINDDAASVIDFEITSQNYSTCGAIGLDFSEQVRLALFDQVTTSSTVIGVKPTMCTVNSLLPAVDDSISSTGPRILSFNLVFDKAHLVNTFKLQCFSDRGESYAILGGDRLSSGSTGTSLICTKVDSKTLSVQGLYPMQRHTQNHVFLRTDLASSNIETASLSGVSGSHTVPSNILGFFENDSEFIHFTSRTDTEFSLVVTQRNLSALRLYLTDSKSRPLGRIASSSSKTAAGPGDSQSTKGNLNFQTLIRIDTMQFAVPKGLKTTLQKTADVKQSGVMTVL